MKLIDIIDATPIRYGYRIAFLTNFFREPILRRIEQEFGLIRPEWTVLICLKFRNGIAQRDICEITEQPSNTVSRGVRSLEKKGHVLRRSDPKDGRSAVIEITDSGRVIYDGAMQICIDGEAKMMECLNETERADLDRLLDKMCRAVPDWA
jgi:DNA-binding MarR family transcriptional regulator